MDLDYEGDVVHQGESVLILARSEQLKFIFFLGWLTKSPPLENRKQIFNQSLIQPVSFFTFLHLVQTRRLQIFRLIELLLPTNNELFEGIRGGTKSC